MSRNIMKRHVMTHQHDFVQACSLHGETKQTLSAAWRSLGAQMSVWFSSFLLQLEKKKKNVFSEASWPVNKLGKCRKATTAWKDLRRKRWCRRELVAIRSEHSSSEGRAGKRGRLERFFLQPADIKTCRMFFATEPSTFRFSATPIKKGVNHSYIFRSFFFLDWTGTEAC